MADSNPAPLTQNIFEEDDLALVGVSLDAVDVNDVRKWYRRRVLADHPDKGGSCERFTTLHDTYKRLESAFALFTSMKATNPSLTVPQVTGRCAARRRGEATSSSGVNTPAESPSVPVAPSWHVEHILQFPLQPIHQVLEQLQRNTFDVTFHQLAAKLQALRPGQSYTVGVRGVQHPAEGTEKVSWHFFPRPCEHYAEWIPPIVRGGSCRAVEVARRGYTCGLHQSFA